MDIKDLKDKAAEVKEKVEDVLDKTDIDEKIMADPGSIKDKALELKDKFDKK